MAGSFGKYVKQLLQNPLASGLSLEDEGHILAHSRILQSNPVLTAAYVRWYKECLPTFRSTESLPGTLLELGCGVGFLEKYIPNLVKTDSVPNPHAQRVEDAMNLTCAPESLRAIFAIQIFHHLSSPARFLSEAQRCLVAGGRLVVVDTNNSFPQKILCRFLDHYEYFDDSSVEWDTPTAGKMLDANLAKAWMVFIRDADRFHAEFPNLKINRIRYHTFLAYILSGGMTYRPFIPRAFLPLLNFFEFMMRPLGKWMSTGMTIEIQKLPDGADPISPRSNKK